MKTMGKGDFTKLTFEVIGAFQKFNATKYDAIVLCSSIIAANLAESPNPKEARETLNEIYTMVSGAISKKEMERNQNKPPKKKKP